MYAHIAGIPVEETALSFAPLAGFGIVRVIAARQRIRDWLHAVSPRQFWRSGR
jgi:hypothetical protein